MKVEIPKTGTQKLHFYRSQKVLKNWLYMEISRDVDIE